MKIRSNKQQKGVVIIQVVMALVVILGVAALALDLGHAYLNKTRLQNALDAAALSGAKVLDDLRDTTAATSAATTIFGQNANTDATLNQAWSNGEITLTVQFSTILNPFTPGSTTGPYVRVRAQGLSLQSWFARVFGILELPIAGSAVAGPSAAIEEICNVVPVMVCGDTTQPAPWYGYAPGQEVTLKLSSPNDAMGSGQFQLARLSDSSGGSDIREALAGAYEGCINIGDEAITVDPEPGNTTGPTVQGIDTRFDECGPPSLTAAVCEQYNIKPDLVTDEGISYSDYLASYAAKDWDYPPPPSSPPPNPPYGQADRRIVVVPIVNCTGKVGGASGSFPLLGLGCFFLRSPADPDLYGEFIGDCEGLGVPGSGSGGSAGSTFYRIILHNDPDSDDS